MQSSRVNLEEKTKLEVNYLILKEHMSTYNNAIRYFSNLHL